MYDAARLGLLRADAVNVDDLEQSAVVMAVMAWHAAMRDEPIPRRRK